VHSRDSLAWVSSVAAHPDLGGSKLFVRGYVGALIALVLLGGCAGDDLVQVPTAATSSAASAPTAAPARTAKREPETPRQFIRRWFRAYELMISSADSAPFRRISKECADCRGIQRRIDAIFESDGEIFGGEAEIIVIRPVGRSRGSQSWVAEFNAGPTRYRDKPGADMRTLLGGHGGYRFVLRSTRRTFRIVRLYQESL